ncbi:undecaprenyl-phosphate glucose phosphotransferase [Paenibacillus sp. CMAA1364]
MIRSNQGILTKLYIISDFLVIQISFLLAWWIKFNSGLIAYETPLPIEKYTLWSLVYGGIAVVIGLLMTLYSPKRKKRFADEFVKVIQVHSITMFVLISIMFIMKEIDISRVYLAIYLGLNMFFIIFYRYFLKASLKHFREKGYNRQFVLIVGAGSLGKRFFNNLKQYPELGYEVIGFLDDNQEWDNIEAKHYSPILGSLDDLADILNRELVDEVVLALPLMAHSKYKDIIMLCEKAGVRTLIIPDFFDYLPARPYFDNFAGMPMINVRDIPLDIVGNQMVKRLFDIVFSFLTIILISPIMLVVAIGVRCTSPGPIIFKQERVGLNRRKFMMYKFRSMKQQKEDEEDTGWTVENDPRRTRFGTFIRSTSIDELPQFFNVLMGDMSVVGPRPERPYYVEQFRDEIPKYMVKHHVRPGITGWAQTNGLRGDTSIEDRINYDIFYIENWTILLDIKIIMKTIKNGFNNNNAY